MRTSATPATGDGCSTKYKWNRAVQLTGSVDIHKSNFQHETINF